MTIAGLDLLDIEIVEVIVVEIEGAGIEAVDGGGVVQIEDVDAISAAGEECSDGVRWNMLYALPDAIAAGREFLGFLGVSDHGVDGQAIHHGNTSSKGCEKEKTVRVNHMVSGWEPRVGLPEKSICSCLPNLVKRDVHFSCELHSLSVFNPIFVAQLCLESHGRTISSILLLSIYSSRRFID